MMIGGGDGRLVIEPRPKGSYMVRGSVNEVVVVERFVTDEDDLEHAVRYAHKEWLHEVTD